MTEILIIIIIGVCAAAYLSWVLYRVIKKKRGCAGCAMKDICGSNKDDKSVTKP